MKKIVNWFLRRRELRRNRRRAEAVEAVSALLAGMAQAPQAEEGDFRRGLLLASGFCGAMGDSLRGKGSGLSMVVVDGEQYPMELQLAVGRWNSDGSRRA